jgi:holliday junction DNA helicase RuvA
MELVVVRQVILMVVWLYLSENATISLDMIGSLRGVILEINPPKILLEVASIGYFVSMSHSSISGFRSGDELFVYIHDHIREDSHDLFGFLSTDELRLFERMISISGVGPKIALAILSSGSVESVKKAMVNGDLTTLTSVPGVGKKIAQKIILELKGQIVDADIVSTSDREVVDALVSLGYSAVQAKEALKTISPDITDVSERVRSALQSLSR